MANSNIQDAMDSNEINRYENKKVWIAPELEVLDGRKTYGGEWEGHNELDYFGDTDFHGDTS